MNARNTGIARPQVGVRLFVAAAAAVVALEMGAAALPTPAGAVEALWLKIILLRVLEIAAILGLARFFPPGLSALGIRRGLFWRGVWRGILWGLCFLGFVVVVGAALIYIAKIPVMKMLSGGLPRSHDKFFVFSYLFAGTVVAGISEEILFRGLLFGFLRRWGFPLALIASTALFAFSHGAAPYTQVVGGLLFASAYEKEKNLLTPMTLHAGGNFLLYALPMIFSGGPSLFK